jgi:hypothetical protein
MFWVIFYQESIPKTKYNIISIIFDKDSNSEKFAVFSGMEITL